MSKYMSATYHISQNAAVKQIGHYQFRKYSLWEKMRIWAEGEMWHYKILLLPISFYFAWAGFAEKFVMSDGAYHWYQPTILLYPTLAVHEFGHLFANTFTQEHWIVSIMGTSFQLLIVFWWIFINFKVGRYFFGAFLFVYLGMNLFDISGYMSTAQNFQGLTPLVNWGGAGITPETHDWAFLFQEFGLLKYHMQISEYVHYAGFVCIGIFWILALYMISHMMKSKDYTPEVFTRVNPNDAWLTQHAQNMMYNGQSLSATHFAPSDSLPSMQIPMQNQAFSPPTPSVPHESYFPDHAVSLTVNGNETKQ